MEKTVLLFTPNCKNDDCNHDFKPFVCNVNLKISDSELETILGELGEHFNYNYVVEIREICEFYGCDFEIEIIEDEDKLKSEFYNGGIERILQCTFCKKCDQKLF